VADRSLDQLVPAENDKSKRKEVNNGN